MQGFLPNSNIGGENDIGIYDPFIFAAIRYLEIMIRKSLVDSASDML